MNISPLVLSISVVMARLSSADLLADPQSPDAVRESIHGEFARGKAYYVQGGGYHPGIHQLESDAHRNERSLDTEYPVKSRPLAARPRAVTSPSKKVFGYHPYWAPPLAYAAYDYSVLSHIGYFSYETDTATGGYLTVRGWNTTPLIDTAHSHGVRVSLVVTNFGYDNNDKILGDSAKQSTMIAGLIQLLQSRNGDGVNFDLEGVRGIQRSNLVRFMQRAAAEIKAQVPAAEISMATPAVDWDSAFDLPQLSQTCDYLILMGYDYYWSGSATAGPVAPLEGEQYDVTSSVTSYLSAGVSAGRLLLGVPWYGYDWPVTGSRRKSAATGSGVGYPYQTLEPEAEANGKTFDVTTQVPWFGYQSSSQWHQAWYDDSTSLALKYLFANSKNLAGIGIWALSYQGDGPELWSGIRNAFPDTAVSAVPVHGPKLPLEYTLSQNFPNPFNPATTIAFTLAGRSRITVEVMDVLGKKIRTLIDGQRMEAGDHRIVWNGRDNKGNTVASGVYFYRLIASPVDGSEAYRSTKQMVFLK